jgi:hypothetical protein
MLQGVVRRKDDRRKAQREAAAKRKAEEAAAMAEQIKRLKSAKRREIAERQALLIPAFPEPQFWQANVDVCQYRFIRGYESAGSHRDGRSAPVRLLQQPEHVFNIRQFLQP